MVWANQTQMLIHEVALFKVVVVKVHHYPRISVALGKELVLPSDANVV